MKKSKGVILLRIVYVAVLLVALFGMLHFGNAHADKPEPLVMPEEMPEDFDFALSYGIGGNQRIDTFEKYAVKDLIQEGAAEAKIELTDGEMKSIYEKMKEINVMGDLGIDTERSCSVEPAKYSDWQILIDGRVIDIEFEEYCDSAPKGVKEMMALEEYVHGLVASKAAYKALPEPTGSYE